MLYFNIGKQKIYTQYILEVYFKFYKHVYLFSSTARLMKIVSDSIKMIGTNCLKLYICQFKDAIVMLYCY